MHFPGAAYVSAAIPERHARKNTMALKAGDRMALKAGDRTSSSSSSS